MSHMEENTSVEDIISNVTFYPFVLLLLHLLLRKTVQGSGFSLKRSTFTFKVQW